MSDDFFQLSEDEQRAVIETVSAKSGHSPQVLEKDLWLCWAFAHLFSAPGSLPMAFKGGTSLSKVFGILDRFSEDIDITIDFPALDNSRDPIDGNLSNTQKKRFSDGLKEKLAEHIKTVIAPHFSAATTTLPPHLEVTIDYEEGRETLNVNYKPLFNENSSYLKDAVLIEFGGRNTITPSDTHIITPYLTSHTTGLVFPSPQINVLSPERTFWEKATLAHVECHRGRLRKGPDRMARHWYDLFQFSNHEIGGTAIANIDLLHDVVKIKKVFFDAGYTNYDACLTGNLRLVPDAEDIAGLKADYEAMIASGMFLGEPPTFEELITQIRLLEERINNRMRGTSEN